MKGGIFYEQEGNLSQRLETNSSPKVMPNHMIYKIFGVFIRILKKTFKNIRQTKEALSKNTLI